MTRIKRPSISSRRKIDELFNFLQNNDMEILAGGNSDNRLVIRVGDNYYACVNSDIIPPTFDNFDLIKSNCEGTIVEYDENDNMLFEV